MSLLLKLKERSSNERIEINNVINEYVEEIDSKTKNKENNVNKNNEKVRVDIDIQALANALQYVCCFDYSKKNLLHSRNPEVIRISLDENIIIETIDSHIINYDGFVETMLPIIKLRIKIDDTKVKFLVLKKNIYYNWEIDVRRDMFPMFGGVINFINKWSKDQLNKKREIEKLKEYKEKQKEQEKLERLIEIYEEYKKYEE